MKDYFLEAYHEMRAAQEDYGKRLTAALIEYVEDRETNLAAIAEAYQIQQSVLSRNAQLYLRPEYHRARGQRRGSAPRGEKAKAIMQMLAEGVRPADAAREVGVTRQYVYEVTKRYGNPA